MYKIILFFLFFSGSLFAQDGVPFKIYNAQGVSVSYKEMEEQCGKADGVFFGELHDNPICHWLELQLLKSLYNQKGDKLVLGMEMFESDNQLIVNEYFQNLITKRNFEKECRLWDNYYTDYKPMLEFAKEKGMKFIATNVPRRYASYVSNNGLAELGGFTNLAADYFAPLPILYDETVGCYKAMFEMSEGNSLFPQAQALKDATMAHFLLLNLEAGESFFHINGSFHSDDHEGILWYINQYRKGLNLKTISSVLQADVNSLAEESLDKADFIIVIAEDMSSTYKSN